MNFTLIPDPPVVASGPQYYAGSSAMLTCTHLILDPYVNIRIQFIWRQVKGLSPRGTASTQAVPPILQSTLTIPSLSITDAGTYQCIVSVTPKTPSPYILSYNATSEYSLSVNSKGYFGNQHVFSHVRPPQTFH